MGMPFNRTIVTSPEADRRDREIFSNSSSINSSIGSNSSGNITSVSSSRFQKKQTRWTETGDKKRKTDSSGITASHIPIHTSRPVHVCVSQAVWSSPLQPRQWCLLYPIFTTAAAAAAAAAAALVRSMYSCPLCDPCTLAPCPTYVLCPLRDPCRARQEKEGLSWVGTIFTDAAIGVPYHFLATQVYE